ncbi:MAG: Sec-independent protein translocase protein TatB [Candidatus Thiodiazotropha sp. (ex Lucinoma aequizonata)]|nr:Sec-independent protein translocase protein TatB [Candidatus Thiodiazotropha sp. (ex Lucinoma aequizonata)]MCU7888467.1 Sec-independent protein translocase protein TatB [Candidatus Thiodiazotropha sp. (ex Lucinoma aequizonata)]MCU7895292.1 Sec-independent protein translocase protein TatB [Candidatus Thiodiazotropha sp. (ex Lucinoma aequizonata)]MCU7898193.1 Sec-independent protein translocase protein TatB [Candidatus Thiodiazotropha sp. (ex Lucinoma aequizonata)]MCU7902200.1 Sec-independent 
MFDVGFWELTIIALVVLIVIGPERLPKVARTAGIWLGRGRRFIANVKADIDKEIKAEELKEVIEKQATLANSVHEILEETRNDLNQIKQEVGKQVDESQVSLDSHNVTDSKGQS